VGPVICTSMDRETKVQGLGEMFRGQEEKVTGNEARSSAAALT